MDGAVEVRCPQCRRFLVEVPEGTPVRVRCRDCRMVFERVARDEARRAARIGRVRVRVVGVG